MKKGCGVHLLLIGALFVVLAALFLYRFGEHLGVMWQNAQAIQDGQMEARAMRSPEDVWAYIVAHPETWSLVVLEGDSVVYGLSPEDRRATAGLARVLTLAAFATSGIDTAEVVSGSDLTAWRLPGAENQTEPAADATLGALAQRVASRGEVSAHDALLRRVGPERTQTLAAQYGMDAPRSLVGTFLSWNNHTFSTPPDTLVSVYAHLDSVALNRQIRTLDEGYAVDATFRDAERAWRSRREGQVPVATQAALANVTFPTTSALAYARFLRDVVSNPTGPRSLVRNGLALPPAEDAPSATYMATAGGYFPGLVSFAATAHPEGSAPVTVVLLGVKVPLAVFYHLAQTGMDRGLVLGLASDPAYRAARLGP